MAKDEVLRRGGFLKITNFKCKKNIQKIPFLRGGERLSLETGWIPKKTIKIMYLTDWQKKSLFPYWELPKNKNLEQRSKDLRKAGNL
ncbi:MAG: hypothetical protein NT007_09245 [Candidatus Kapabacteria bacterium]|nr:hypothetical protein [Candidatus Kapabacteria bacterium]